MLAGFGSAAGSCIGGFMGTGLEPEKHMLYHFLSVSLLLSRFSCGPGLCMVTWPSNLYSAGFWSGIGALVPKIISGYFNVEQRAARDWGLFIM